MSFPSVLALTADRMCHFDEARKENFPRGTNSPSAPYHCTNSLAFTISQLISAERNLPTRVYLPFRATRSHQRQSPYPPFAIL